MTEKIMISHDHRDHSIANIIANTLSRISLRQIDAWYSSDINETGGIQPGSVWLDEIRNRLNASKAVLVLLTPTSINRPWLLFESGYGAALGNCDVIPVGIDIDVTRDLPFPLAMYQAYKVNNYDSLKNLMARILTKYDVVFDEDLSKSVLESAISEIIKAASEIHESATSNDRLSVNEQFEKLRTHIDRRFREFLEQSQNQLPNNTKIPATSNISSYEVPIHIDFPKLKTTQYVTIERDTTIQAVLDDVFYMLRPEVEVFTYMEKWILREVNSNKNLVIREVTSLIPAHYIFTQNSEWNAISIEEPYSALHSSDSVRRSR